MGRFKVILQFVLIGVSINSVQGVTAAVQSEGSGNLAIKTDQGEWVIVDHSQPIAARAALKSSTGGVVQLNIGDTDDTQITLDQVSYLDLDETQRSLHLHGGRVLVKVPAGWTLTASGWRLVTKSVAEVVLTSARDHDQVTIVAGEVSVQQGELSSETISQASSVSIKNGKLYAHPLDADQIADRSVWAQRKTAQGLGQLLVRAPQEVGLQRLEIARSHINVVMQPSVALVQIDQSFFNPGNAQAEGTFVFNLPRGASVSRFAMFVTHDQLIEGEVVERQKARRVYQWIVSGRKDPAILEQIGDNLFRMRVFPIFARDTKRILLDFTIPIEETATDYTLKLPLMSDRNPIWDFQIGGTLVGPFTPGNVQSSSHPQLNFQQQRPGEITFSEHAEQIRPPATFELSIQKPETEPPQLHKFVSQKNGSDEMYFLATLPPVAAQPQAGESPTDIMLLVDTSASAGDLKQPRAIARLIAENLRASDRLQLGCVDVELRMLTDEWVSGETAELTNVLRQLDQEIAMGSSRLSDPFLMAARLLQTASKPERRTQMIYVGDGISSSHESGAAFESTMSVLTDRGIAFSAVITDSGVPVPDNHTAEFTRSGQLFDLRSTRVDHRALFDWTLSGFPQFPRITSASVQDESAELFYPSSTPPGQSIKILGKCNPQNEVHLKLVIDGAAVEHTLRPNVQLGAQDAVFTGRLWAQEKLQRISDNGSKETQAEIVKLSQEWSLLSKYTAFLVLESEADYPRWGILRNRRHRYWAPPQKIQQLPYPPHIVELLRKPPTSPELKSKEDTDQQANTVRGARLLKAAQQALAQQEPTLANRYLVGIEDLLTPELRPVYLKLKAEVDQALATSKILSNLGPQRAQFDLSQPPALPHGEFFPLLLGAGGISDDFRKLHPLVDQMLQPIEAPGYPVTLEVLAKYIQDKAGIQVIVNKQVLGETGTGLDDEINLSGPGTMSVRSFLKHALADVGGVELTYLEEPGFIKVTTKEDAEEQLTTRSFPVVDLVQTDQVTNPSFLSDPYLDQDIAFRTRVEQKLDQPCSLNTTGMSLQAFKEWLKQQTGENVQVFEQDFAENGVRPDDLMQEFELREVPLRKIVQLALEDVGGTIQLDHEVIVVTTVEDAEEELETQLYSGVGVLFELPQELFGPVPQNRSGGSWGGMGFGGGFGGAAGGAFGGGGFGGGGGGGFGGSGGAVDPGSNESSIAITPSPSETAVQLFDLGEISKAATASAEANTDQQDDEFEVPLPVDSSNFLRQQAVDSDSVIESIQNSTEGPWFEIDGLGGAVDFFRPVHAFVIRQTQHVHEEVAEHFRTLRNLPTAGRVKHARLPHISADDPAGWDTDTLKAIIQQQTEGPWFEIDGLGGTVDPHYPTISLAVRQSQKELKEVRRLLTMLRRQAILNRYQLQLLDQGLPVPDALHWNSSLTLTPLSPQNPAPRSGITNQELELLKTRNINNLSQRWSLVQPDGTTRTYSFKRKDNRWQLADQQGTTLRVEGNAGVVMYKNYGVAEQGPWGEALRQLTAGILPWLPHLTNEQLAATYDIEPLESSDDATWLSLRHYQNPQVVIEASFEKPAWRVKVANELLYELLFTTTDTRRTVEAIDANGGRLLTWEGIPETAASEVPQLEETGGLVLVNRDMGVEGTYHKVRNLLMKYDYTAAAELLTQELNSAPQQPFWNFLLAWCCEHGPDTIPNRQARLHAAVRNVARSDASDLIRLLTMLNFNKLNEVDLLQALLSTPFETRSLATLDLIVELAEKLHRYNNALEIVDHALSLPDGDTDERQLDRLRLLYHTQQLGAANQLANRLLPSLTNSSLVTQLGDIAGAAQQLELADRCYAKAITAVPEDAEKRAQLFVRAAYWHTGAPRWNYLTQAADLWTGLFGNTPLNVILAEAVRGEDADVLKNLQALAKRPEVKLQLLMHRIDIMSDKTDAARLARELLESGDLPRYRGEWALRRIVNGGEQQYVIELLESGIRNGRRVPYQLMSVLADAYEKDGQATQARRARASEVDFREISFRGSGRGFF